MSEMKKSAEKKLAELKAEQQRVEKELYDMHNSIGDSGAALAGVAVGVRAAAVAGGGGGDEADSMEQQMRRAYVEFKRAREKATAALSLEQRARAGLKHVAEILGIQQTDPAAQVHEMVHQIEGVLDVLQDEAERHQQQKLIGGDHNNKANNNKHQVRTGQRPLTRGSDHSLTFIGSQLQEINMSRPPELQEALKSFESPKARIPYHLVNRPVKEEEQGSGAVAWGEVNNSIVTEEEDREAVKSRRDVKIQAMKSLRAEQRRAGKKNVSAV